MVKTIVDNGGYMTGIKKLPDAEFEIMNIVWPVSYTHLDVYKRQSSHCSENVYSAKSRPKISSCVMKMIIVDGKCLYFVIFPAFSTGVSSMP